MKRRILIGILCVFFAQGMAQELPLYNQYLLNNYFINPCVAGTRNYTSIRLTERLQWLSFPGAPQTGALSVYSLLGKHNGVGGMVYSDVSGAMDNKGLKLSYAFHATLTKGKNRTMDHKFAVGASASLGQYYLNPAKLGDLTDIAAAQYIQKAFLPDVDFGVLFYNKKYFAGITVAQLLQYFIKSNDYIYHDLYLFANGGYRFALGRNIELEPSLAVKKALQSPMQLDINGKVYFNPDDKDETKTYWFGVSYSMFLPASTELSNTVLVIMGLKLAKNFYAGYGFGYTTSNIMRNSFGNHEIMLGIDIPRKGNRDQVCPAYF